MKINYIVECSNEQEWEAVKATMKRNCDFDVLKFRDCQKDYPNQPIAIIPNKNQWSRLSFFTEKKSNAYKNYKFVTAQEYLNPISEPLLFN